jgi:hypothetical protein
MAVVTTAGSGNWNSTTNNAPWPGGTIPAATDTIIIDQGHTLTVPVGYTAEAGVAASPGAGTTATKANASVATRTTAGGNGKLVVNGTLRVASDMVQGNAEWTVGAGGIVESSNTGTLLNWWTGDGSGQSAVQVRLVGTSWAAPATVRKGSGATGLRFNNTWDGAARGGVSYFWDFARLEELGNASNDNLLGCGGFSTNVLRLRDVLIKDCGQVILNNGSALAAGAECTMQRLTVKGCTHATRALDLSVGGSRTGITVVEDIAITTKLMRMTGIASQFNFVRCAFIGEGEGFSSGASLTDCLINQERTTSGGATTVSSNWTRGFFTTSKASRANWHGIAFGAGATANATFDGIIFDGAATGGDGDLFLFGNPSSARTVTLRNLLCTKSSTAGGHYGILASFNGGANLTLDIMENCTYFNSSTGDALENGMIRTGEGYVGRANMIGIVRNNLCVSATSARGALLVRDSPGGTSNIRDSATPGNITNNNIQNPLDQALGNGVGYYTAVTSGDEVMWTSNPAASLNEAPTFVDDTRSLATWIRSLVGGTPGTREEDTQLALDSIAGQYDPDVTPVSGATITAAYEWIRAGFAPQNTALKTDVSANNGGWLGAVEGITPGVQLTPDATVSNTNWSAVGAASLHAALAAGDSDYITASVAGAVSVVALSDPSPLLTLTDASFTVRARLN